MTKIGDYEVHPVADLFAMLEGADWENFKEDIRRAGLREPVTLTSDGLVADGRNRLKACLEVERDPVFSHLPACDEDEVIAFVLRANELRRHEDAVSRAFIAAKLKPFYAEAAKQRQIASGGSKAPANQRAVEAARPQPNGRGPQARDEAAAAVGASGRSTQRAEAVIEHAPELEAQVRNGDLSLEAAEKKALAAKRAKAKARAPAKPKETITLYTHKGDPIEYPKPQGKPKFNETPGDGISWAHWSWNPVTGCEHGCDYCYAREIAMQDKMRAAYPAGFTPLFHEERLSAPRNTSTPQGDDPALRRVFVCSMADLYGGWVPKNWVDAVHASELENPQWTYIHLTKYPKRYLKVELPPSGWIGASVDQQKRVKHTEDAFREIEGVAVKWLSLEPLLEPLEFSDLSMFDWIVIGAQTETRQPWGTVSAFQPPARWVARIDAQAQEAGVPVHWKPNLLGRVSPQLPGMELPNEYPEVSNAK